MSKYICQGTKCHTYDTQSRIRGTKGNKVLRTRYAYGSSDSWNANRWELYFCDERCMNDWLKEHIQQFMQIVGINTKPNEPIKKRKRTSFNYRYSLLCLRICWGNANSLADFLGFFNNLAYCAKCWSICAEEFICSRQACSTGHRAPPRAISSRANLR